MMEIEKSLHTVCVFIQNKLTSNIQGILFNTVIKHFIVAF